MNFFAISAIFFVFKSPSTTFPVSSGVPQVMEPRPRTSVTQVAAVVLVGIRLPLKTDVVIRPLRRKSVLHQSHQELHSIPQEEQHKAHLPLLTGVDEFVVQFVKCHPTPLPLHEDDAEEVESVVGAERDETVVNHSHDYKGTQKSWYLGASP